MPKISKEKGIELILLELEKGKDRASTLAMFSENWQTATRTFDRWWKDANVEYKERQAKTSAILMKAKIENEKELLKTALNDKNSQAKEMALQIEELKQIKAGKALKIGSEIIIATFSDEIRAKGEIRQITKMIGDWYGFNAPLDANINHTGEMQVKRVFKIERMPRTRPNPLKENQNNEE